MTDGLIKRFGMLLQKLSPRARSQKRLARYLETEESEWRDIVTARRRDRDEQERQIDRDLFSEKRFGSNWLENREMRMSAMVLDYLRTLITAGIDIRKRLAAECPALLSEIEVLKRQDTLLRLLQAARQARRQDYESRARAAGVPVLRSPQKDAAAYGDLDALVRRELLQLILARSLGRLGQAGSSLGKMQKPLERSSLEAYGGIVIAIIVAIFPDMLLWAKGLLLLIAACLTTDAVYRAPLTINLNGWLKRAIALGVWSFAAWAFCFIEPSPSYVYVTPGVWIVDGRWDFIIGHRGQQPVNQVQILFQDQDRLAQIRATQQPISDLSQFQVILSFPEIDPAGRGSIFARQFQWRPFNQERSHFTADITSREMEYGEDIYIAHVSDKWYFALSAKERESRKLLFQCKDAGFPPDQVDIGGAPCFPRWIAYAK